MADPKPEPADQAPADEPVRPKLTDREPLADIQARLRRETDERLRGSRGKRRQM